MSFWTAFGDEIKKLAVESATLEDTATSGEHKAALDTNNERGSKPTKAEEKDKVTSMSVAKAKNGGKVMKKVAEAMEKSEKEGEEGKGKKKLWPPKGKKEEKGDKKECECK